MQANEPFELGLIRCILGLQGTTESLPDAVRKLKKENEKLRKMLDGLLTEMELRGGVK